MPVRKGLRMHELNKQQIVDVSSCVPDISGCYFWLLESADLIAKIYIGRTKSFRKRFRDYSASFQIHSPNDYKLIIWSQFSSKHFPDAALSFHVCPAEENESKRLETEYVNRFRPLLNERVSSSVDERELVKSAFTDQYFQKWKRYLESTD